MGFPPINLYEEIPTGNGKLYVGKERSASFDWWPGRTRVSLSTCPTDAGSQPPHIGYAADIDAAEEICTTWMNSGRILDTFERANS